jgi:hypothetical protein
LSYHKQATGQNDAASSEENNESSQLYNLANSIVEECNNETPLSDLDTAIYLFREAVIRRPAPHPLRSDSIKDLVKALVTRFSLTNQIMDLDEAIVMRVQIFREAHDMMATGGQSQLDVDIHSQSDSRI